MKVVVICGAKDPEMDAVAQLAGQCGCTVAYAYRQGARVHSDDAYDADSIRLADGTPCELPPDAHVIQVECGGPALDGVPSIICDHHRPGDPGYGRSPGEYLAASAVGQVIAALARLNQLPDSRLARHDGLTYVTGEDGPDYVDGPVTGEVLSPYIRWRIDGIYGSYHIPQHIVLTAAADHCLEAASRGLCPGVDPDDLMQFRAQSRAAVRGVSVEQVLAEIEDARERLRDAVCGHRDPAGHHYIYVAATHITEVHGDRYTSRRLPSTGTRRICKTGTYIADFRGKHLPELEEAAFRERIPFLTEQVDRDGRRKVVLMAAPQGSDIVQRFMFGDIVTGLVDYYGDPVRGVAGGYYPHTS